VPQAWRTVRVFISSTFRDVQGERDRPRGFPGDGRAPIYWRASMASMVPSHRGALGEFAEEETATEAFVEEPMEEQLIESRQTPTECSRAVRWCAERSCRDQGSGLRQVHLAREVQLRLFPAAPWRPVHHPVRRRHHRLGRPMPSLHALTASTPHTRGRRPDGIPAIAAAPLDAAVLPLDWPRIVPRWTATYSTPAALG